MKPTDSDSPLTLSVGEFETDDEIYYNLQVAPFVKNLKNHLMGYYHEMRTPLLLTCEGGRIDGAGKVGYFGLGHSMGSMEAPEVKTLFMNTVNWLLE